MIQLLKIDHLSAQVSSKSEKPFTLFKDINLQINARETTALLQTSARSASILLQAIAGLYPHSDGNITFKGHDTESILAFGIQFTTPILFQKEVINDSVIHYLLPPEKRKFNFFASSSKISEPQIRQYLKETGCELEYDPDKTIKELPPVQVAFLSLLPALLRQPELLLLDTLTTPLPEEITGQLFQYLCPLFTIPDKALCFTTDSPQLAFRFAKKIYLLDEQSITREITNEHQAPEILEQLFQATEFSAYRSSDSPGVSKLASEQYV